MQKSRCDLGRLMHTAAGVCIKRALKRGVIQLEDEESLFPLPSVVLSYFFYGGVWLVVCI